MCLCYENRPSVLHFFWVRGGAGWVGGLITFLGLRAVQLAYMLLATLLVAQVPPLLHMLHVFPIRNKLTCCSAVAHAGTHVGVLGSSEAVLNYRGI